jgi:hypothetical protein
MNKLSYLKAVMKETFRYESQAQSKLWEFWGSVTKIALHFPEVIFIYVFIYDFQINNVKCFGQNLGLQYSNELDVEFAILENLCGSIKRMLFRKIRIAIIIQLYKVMTGLMLDYRAAKMNRSEIYIFLCIVCYRRSSWIHNQDIRK